jgi:hypothetical protein
VNRLASFRRALIITSLVMLAGIGMLAVSASAAGGIPLSWTRAAALFLFAALSLSLRRFGGSFGGASPRQDPNVREWLLRGTVSEKLPFN